MGSNTRIQWTDRTWSPLRVKVRENAAEIAQAKGYTSLIRIGEKMAGHVGPHCEHVSTECSFCYSGSENKRCLPANGTGLPFDRRSRDLVQPFVDYKVLDQPLHWRLAKRTFVENQSDLFGEWWPETMIRQVWDRMASTPKETYQVLTKRAAAMRSFLRKLPALPNVWVGVSVGNQPAADERRADLEWLAGAGWTTFVSYEPALGPVRWDEWRFLAWLIIGGESGRGARPFSLRWARSAIQTFRGSDTAVFMKQFGRRPGTPSCADFECTHPDCSVDWLKLEHSKGGDWDEWAEEFRVRQFPEGRRR